MRRRQLRTSSCARFSVIVRHAATEQERFLGGGGVELSSNENGTVCMDKGKREGSEGSGGFWEVCGLSFVPQRGRGRRKSKRTRVVALKEEDGCGCQL